MGRTVWIVCQDETPDNTVLGVFETQEEAWALATELQGSYENGAICFSWEVGTRCGQGRRYSTDANPAT